MLICSATCPVTPPPLPSTSSTPPIRRPAPSCWTPRASADASSSPPRESGAPSRTASRCVGAQYVASLDGSAAGGLVEMPRVGAAMLFARVDENGRVSLVRTAVVTSFESKAAEDPFAETGSGAVETSAPELDAPRAPRQEELDVDYYDPSERTQRIQALRPERDRRGARRGARRRQRDGDRRIPCRRRRGERRVPKDAARRSAPLLATPASTTRTSTASRGAPAPSRGALPRVSDAPARPGTARAYALAPRPTPASDVQLSRRHRGR